LFKKILGPIAINAKAKIVPVIHSGVQDCLPYGKWRIRPGKVTVRFLKAIPTEEMQYEDRQGSVNTLRAIAEQKLFGDQNSSLRKDSNKF
jgi:1-acyl-sn-glycerol-3-phosphate acyltransferase